MGYSREHESRAIPLGAKLGFTAWMLFWVPVILWAYGPQNFFWLCNMAQFLVLYGVWSQNRLVLSSQAGVMTLVGAGWTLDFLIGLPLGDSVTGFTSFMFDETNPLLARATSLYHVGLPPFLLWLVHRVGYDRRGPWLQCGIGAAGVTGGWLFTDPERNVNLVHRVFGMEQVWMPEPLFVAFLVLLYPLIIFFPGHGLTLLVLRWTGRRAPGD